MFFSNTTDVTPKFNNVLSSEFGITLSVLGTHHWGFGITLSLSGTHHWALYTPVSSFHQIIGSA